MFDPPDRANYKVLVADDDDDVRELLCELLTIDGYQVLPAKDGDEAMEHAGGNDVNLALIDVMMPKRTGFAVCRSLKSDPHTRLLPVILITGLSSTEDRIHGIECGADDFLSKPIRREELRARAHSLLRLKTFTDELECAETVLSSLALSIEAKDVYTQGHCDRLSRLSDAFAAHLGHSEHDRLALRRAGLVHDIGKVAVPESILLKPGPLDAAERKIMEEHPVVGEKICAPLKAFRPVLPIIRHHHERFDGSGYPDGLRGEAIPVTARILPAVDIYDALTTDRPYRKALGFEEALKIMRSETARGWMDPRMMDAFDGFIELQESKLSMVMAS